LKTLHVISWSGGRASTAMLHYLINGPLRGEDYRVLFIDTTITVPHTLEHIEEILDLLDYGLRDRFDVIGPKKTFEEYLKQFHIWPAIKALWCRKYLKLLPVRDYYKELYRGERKRLVVYLGISTYDSPWRDKRYRGMGQDIRRYGYAWVESKYPLLKWSPRRTRSYCKKHGIPENPAYQALGNSGCYTCPYLHLKYYKHLRVVCPDLFNRLLELEEELGSRIHVEFSLKSLASIQPLANFINT